MSMSHKAFAFDFDAFERELRPILDKALHSGSLEPLRAFIQTHREELKDPYEGEPLDESWESSIESKDAHQYGDFALTKFYEPSSNIGLHEDWEAIEEALKTEGLSEAIVLGKPVGPAENLFDPGKQGSYFQSAQMAEENRRALEDLLRRRPGLKESFAQALTLFDEAVQLRKGLYITF